jgi:hypothetical protein
VSLFRLPTSKYFSDCTLIAAAAAKRARIASDISCSSSYSDDEWQDFIFSAIQQCYTELEENVMEPFVKKHGNSQMEFDDYAAWIELRRLVHSSHTEVRD